MKPGDFAPSNVMSLAGQALARWRDGDLVRARAACLRILSIDGRDFFALNLLGVIAGGQHQYRQAAEWFGKALAVQPDNADAHANRGLAFQELRDFQAALDCYERAIKLQPGSAECHSRRGVVLQAMGRPREALESFDASIARQPGFADAHCNRGNLLRETGRLHEALSSYDRAVALKPLFALAHSNRGNVLRELQRPNEAFACYARALSIDPGCVEALLNRGILLAEMKRPEDALVSFDLAIARHAGHAAAHFHRANALLSLRRPDAALASVARSLALAPDFAAAHSTRGSAHRLLNQFDAALASHDRALALKPDHAEAWMNRGNVLVDLRRSDEAIASFDRAIALQPDLAAAYFCRAIARLQAGDFERGWADYEWRWRSPHTAPLLAEQRQFEQTRWLGERSLAGKSILLHAEQGLGDTIQFCRYATVLADMGARVVLQVPVTLMPLLSTLAGVSRLIAGGAGVPEDVEYHCPLMSLPLALRTQPESVPACIRYLHSEPRRRDEWQRRLAGKGRPLIGVAWSGNPGNQNDHNRSIPLERLMSFLPPQLTYVSLHKEDWGPERRTSNTHPGVLQMADAHSDLADAAALCDSVDLVISVDTSLAHLSAALGRKTWILLPFNADWRWLLERDDTPWYPTARLYRQTHPGDWNATLRRLRADLLLTFDPDHSY